VITYEPWPRDRFGSIEQAIRECEGLLLMLRDPGTAAELYAAFPGCIRGVMEQPAQPVVNVAADADTGHLRLIAVESGTLPGCGDGAILIREGD
jgi:hypothetical protein